MSNNQQKEQVHIYNIEDVMSNGFARYAKYIIQDRALPNVHDGLKPVQRRIIYGMYKLGTLFDKPYKKSARSVGEIMGKYHPHGDSSIYEAMVRMSQSWKNNIPIIDMQGCNGSLDGDGAAAMRYTEARLTEYAGLMINGIEEETVDMVPNYDDAEVEPVVLPSLLPNLLINGASGIAAGYATNIPTFNPCEVFDALITRIDSPNCRLESIKSVMPGPDFPTAGIILNQNGIDEAYRTGKGKIIVRAKIELVNKKQAFITQIPYEVNKAQLIDQIQELGDTHEVLNITDCHDESDENGISICINFKSTDNFEFVKNFLFKNTDCQITYGINMTAICNHKPLAMPILDIIDEFILHSNTIILKSSTFNLKKSIRRKEIVEGIIKAIKIIDAVIDTIRRSADKKSAIEALIVKFAFTELQADAIVSLQLYRLTNTDVTKLIEEAKELEQAIARYTLLIEDKSYRNNHIKTLYREYKKKFNNKRSSTFSNEEAVINIDQSDIIEDRDNYIVVTRDGYIKNVPLKTVQTNNSIVSELKIKEGDSYINIFESNQKHKVVLITSKGNYISIPTYKIDTSKWKDNFIHINSIINIDVDEKIIYAFNFDNISTSDILLISSKKGMIKKTNVEALAIGRLAKSSKIMNLDENDEIVSVDMINKEDDDTQVVVVTIEGRASIYPINQISLVGKNAAGVKNTGAEEDIASSFILNNKPFLCLISNRGMKRVKVEDVFRGNRVNTPKFILSQVKTNPINVVSAFCADQSDIVMYTTNINNYLKASEIPIGDPSTRISQICREEIIYGCIFSKKNLLISNQPTTN